MSPRQTYLLVDGENIDATLGMSVLNRRPHPEERPRWQRVLAHVERAWGQPVRPLFFLAVEGEIPFGFVQALTTMGYQPILLKGSGKVVDIGIQRTAEALVDREADVVLVAVGRVSNSDGLDLDRTGVEVDEGGVIKVDDHQRTNVEGIWALGDVANRFQLKHVSNHEART